MFICVMRFLICLFKYLVLHPKRVKFCYSIPELWKLVHNLCLTQDFPSLFIFTFSFPGGLIEGMMINTLLVLRVQICSIPVGRHHMH